MRVRQSLSQLIDIHRLGRFRRALVVRIASESCRGADGQPVGRLITRPLILLGVNETLQQPRFEPVAGGKVTPHPCHAQAQHPAGKILAVHLRPDQKASHIDYPLLKALARGRIPADPLITLAQMQSARTKTNGA